MILFYFWTTLLISFTLYLPPGLAAIFPQTVNVVEGRDVFLRLKWKNPNQKLCLLKTPNTSITYPLLSKSLVNLNADKKIKFWGVDATMDCGVHIYNITAEDVGYWRLTSMSHNYEKIEGASKILLSENPSSTHQLLIGTKPVLKWGQLEHCPSHFRTNKYKNIRPDIKNVPCDRSEDFTSGWTISNSSHRSISIFCNSNCKERLISCYFIRLHDQVTFSMVDGTGSDRYSYFGDGLCTGDCGINIESPDQMDYGRWQCIVGLDHGWNSHSSFITLSPKSGIISPVDTYHVWDVGYTAALIGQPITLKCRVETAVSECVLIHPNGSVIILNPYRNLSNSGTMWKYEGLGLQSGDCGGTLLAVTLEESGIWKCQMRALNTIEEVYTTHIQVKVTKIPLIAVPEVFEPQLNDVAKLECQAIPPTRVIEYCLFKRPDGTVLEFHENETHYKYFMEDGMCQLNIYSVEMRDIGNWSCIVKIHNEKGEMFATTIIKTPVFSTASAGMGAAVGVAVLVTTIIGLFCIQRFWRRRALVNNAGGPGAEEIEMS